MLAGFYFPFSDSEDRNPIYCRMKARLVVKALVDGDEEEAVEQLRKDRSLAWSRDDESGAYPLHIAASKVRGPCCTPRTRSSSGQKQGYRCCGSPLSQTNQRPGPSAHQNYFGLIIGCQQIESPAICFGEATLADGL